MTQKVKLTQSIDDRDVVRAFQKQNDLLDKMVRKLDQVGSKSAAAGQRTQKSFGQATAGIGKMAAALVGVSSITAAMQLLVNQIRKEIDNIRTRQAEAGQTQVEVAAAQRPALFNTSPELIPKLNKAVADLSEQTGSKQQTLFSTLSGALSFKNQNQTFDDAVNASRIAAQVAPSDAAEQAAVAQGILAQQAALGGSAENTFGQQIKTKQASPVVSSQDFGRFIAPAAAQLADFGNTGREGLALLATVGQGAKDVSGRSTSTNVIKFARDLALATPQLDQNTSTIDRLKFIQSPEGQEIRRRLVGQFSDQLKTATAASEAAGNPELSTEARFFTTFLALLQRGGNKTKELLDTTLGQIPKLEDGGKLFSRQLQAVNAPSAQQAGILQRIFSTGVEGLQLLNNSEGRTGIAREGFEKLLKASGVSATDQELSRLGFDVGTEFGREGSPVKTVITGLQRQAKNLRRGQFQLPTGGSFIDAGVGGGQFAAPKLRPATDEEKASADRLDRVVAALEKIAAQNTAAQRSERAARNSDRREPAAAANSRGDR